MKVDSFLVCSNQFNFTIKCNNIKLSSCGFISFFLDDREVFQCHSNDYYLDFYKLTDFGTAAYVLVKRIDIEEIEEINDSAAIQQEESDKFIYEDKESNIEDFVGFEERLKFFGKMTREYLLKIINEYFPNSETHLKRYGRIEVTTAFGTFFTLVPKKYEGNDIPDYEYEISFAIF
nr:MAG TPA: hypothetical protein [Inoviridae sp.]